MDETFIILHGTWIKQESDNSGFFLVWGEQRLAETSVNKPRGRSAKISAHPYAVSSVILKDVVGEFSEFLLLDDFDPVIMEGEFVLTLPAVGKIPLPSRKTPIGFEGEISLSDFKVSAIYLSPTDAIEFLSSIPYHTYDLPYEIGADVRFWSATAKFTLHLISQQRFLPTLREEEDDFIASWIPVLDDESDTEKINTLTRAMPDACRTAKSILIHTNKVQQDIPESSPGSLILDFLNVSVDNWVRIYAEQNLLPKSLKSLKDEAVIRWLKALTEPTGRFQPKDLRDDLKDLRKLLAVWRGEEKGSIAPKANIRTCFRLEPPEDDSSKWALRYFLQAVDDPSLLIPADVMWKERKATLRYLNREFESPQEQMLAGLGVASRMFPPIEQSLRQAKPGMCLLELNEAYQFLNETSLLLQQSGFGVLAAPWWTQKRSPIKAKISVLSTKTEGSGIISLDSILVYDWQIALGNDAITPEELERLASLKVPLVKMRGEWVLLRPEDIKSAMEFFKKHDESQEISLRDVMQLSLSETPALEGIQIEAIESPQWLDSLITDLKGGSMKQLKQPKDMTGKLRPYQVSGLSWLAFMRQWGLGACLADDMGLGKCLSADSLVSINGSILEAEKIWERYAEKAIWDGEGFWVNPVKHLITNSLDEETGQIIQASINSLYRQRVHEKLRVIHLEDGSSITITSLHKLLTNNGWTNELKIGNYVCVPAKINWEGKEEDADLVKFLAWQIAEGYERKEISCLSIYQKDISVLEDLRQTLYRLSERYNIKINTPAIRTYKNETPYLIMNSKSYRCFLNDKEYQWGSLSRYKLIPDFILKSGIATIRIFLRNYFDAEASVIWSMRSIEISSASRILIYQLAYMLRRLGIWLRINSKQKCATNGSGIYRTYYIGTIGGDSIRRFRQEIGFSYCHKQQCLERICENNNNTNVEGIPASKIVAQIIKTTRLPLRHFGMHNTVYINGSQQFSRKSLEKVLLATDNVISGESERQYRLLNKSKWTNKTLIAYTLLDRDVLFNMRTLLECLLKKNVFYCKIKRIEEIDYDGWVYDFEVDKHHNFVANNILCHNTIQMIALLLHEKKLKKGNSVPNLLICPTSVVGNWQREIAKFAPSLKAMLHHGGDRASGNEFAKSAFEHDLVITSYGLARRDADDLSAIDWNGVMLDEAQNIKNPSSKIAQVVRNLKSKYRFTLTGTPVENRLMELWSIMEFLNPGYLGSQNRFNQRYVVPIERYNDERSTKELKSLVAPFIMRRLKTDSKIINDLPEKIEMKEYCNLTREQVTLYEAVVKDMMEQIEEKSGIERRGLILSILMKLKQLCNHPALFLHDKSDMDGRSGKVQRLTEMLEEVLSEGDKSLIFTQFTEMGEALQQYLSNKFRCDALYLHGGVPQKKRDRMVSLFQENSNESPIFIISIRAGGTGLNLTRANHVFHFDRWWNPAVEDQATDRAFRIGQTKNVQVHKFICTGTLEEQIDQLIEKKKSLAQSIIGAGENWITELSNDDLQKLVTLRRDEALSDDER